MEKQLMKRAILFLLLTSFAVFNALSLAQEQEDPVKFLQTLTNGLIQELNARKAELKKDPGIILDIINRRVMPNIAAKTIARKVMGRHWRAATDEQKEKFTTEFTTYLKRYYAKAFLSYDDQQLRYDEKAKWLSPKSVLVRSELIQKDKAPVEIRYRLTRGKNGWLITDIVIEGVSLVISNQRQYDGLIRREGLDTVIAKLAFANNRPFGEQ
ncbi:MAG: ABC transporter substrate-binding protein [Gammaproteobacteria bacterium]|nr:MAG: ABC transporter substrate-binding protein [Gammaproteobacteria bacterium]